jgi:hypothetical protein
MGPEVFYILFLLVFGSLNTLTTKWQFGMESIGSDGKLKWEDYNKNGSSAWNPSGAMVY